MPTLPTLGRIAQALNARVVILPGEGVLVEAVETEGVPSVRHRQKEISFACLDAARHWGNSPVGRAALCLSMSRSSTRALRPATGLHDLQERTLMPNTYLQAACLGVVAGMRSMGAPALVSDHLAHSQSPSLGPSPLRWLGTTQAATITKFLAAGEVIGDKLPMAPARIAPIPLFGRVMSGGLCGAALVSPRRQARRRGGFDWSGRCPRGRLRVLSPAAGRWGRSCPSRTPFWARRRTCWPSGAGGPLFGASEEQRRGAERWTPRIKVWCRC